MAVMTLRHAFFYLTERIKDWKIFLPTGATQLGIILTGSGNLV